MRKQTLSSILLSCCATVMMAQQSPNGKLTVEPRQQTLVVRYQQQQVLEVETGVDVATGAGSGDGC